MAELITWYLLFAVTTSLSGMYEIILPTMRQLEIYSPTSNILEYKLISYSTFFLMGVLFAPVAFLVCIVPSFGETFKKGLLESLV